MSNIIVMLMSGLNFDQVYADYKDRVWRMTFRYVAHNPDREDVFQEVFINIHRALPKFRGDSKIETWIYRIVANTAINYLKKKNRHKRIKDTLKNLRVINEDAPAFAEDGILHKPLQKLNPQQRMILLMSDVEELKLGEISEILNLPVGTIKSNLFRAREIIKKELKEGEGK